MDLQTRKLELIQAFLKVKSEDVISKIEKLLKAEKSKSTNNELKPMSIEEFNSRIDQSLEDSKNDKVIDQEDLKAILDKWS
jgi:hypothetical protein